ncbi:MAG TPA: cell division protein FtsA, partial [Aequorivita sp.]|nr:cell division protein FtsA [Aequorivita sp.]
IAGIVLTGGGAQLQHIKQLVEYITGMDTRIGYPNEHLAGDSDAETTSPMYATAVGLVLNSLESKEKSSLMKRFSHEETVEEVEKDSIPEQTEEKQKIEKGKEKEKEPKTRIRIFDKWAEKFKEFLDNAE